MTVEFIISEHFVRRMYQRGMNWEIVELVLQYGKKIWAKDSLYFFMGRREAARFGKLAEKLEGIVVVVESKTRVLKTIFRNRKWPSKIRYKK
jgi:hypothetical protein